VPFALQAAAAFSLSRQRMFTLQITPERMPPEMRHAILRATSDVALMRHRYRLYNSFHAAPYGASARCRRLSYARYAFARALRRACRVSTCRCHATSEELGGEAGAERMAEARRLSPERQAMHSLYARALCCRRRCSRPTGRNEQIPAGRPASVAFMRQAAGGGEQTVRCRLAISPPSSPCVCVRSSSLRSSAIPVHDNHATHMPLVRRES